MDSNQKKWVYISLAISAIILCVLLFSTFNEDTITYLKNVNIYFILLAIGLRFVSFSLWGMRIKTMSASLGYKVPFWHCFNMVVANLLMGAITPGQAGGEPVRIHELYKADMNIGDATAVVIMERVLDAIVLIFLSIISLILMWDYLFKISFVLVLIFFISIILLLSFIGLLIWIAKKQTAAKEKIMKFLSWCNGKFEGLHICKFYDAIDVEFDNFMTGVITYSGRRGFAGLAFGTVFTILFWFSEFIVASVILMGLGLPPSVSESIIAQVLIALVSMIPFTPGASGIAELAATSLYALFVPTAVLGVFILLWRLIMFYLNVVFGLISTMFIFKREIFTVNKTKKE